MDLGGHFFLQFGHDSEYIGGFGSGLGLDLILTQPINNT